MRELTENHVKLEIGSQVTFPRQENGDWCGTLVKFLGDWVMREMYLVRADNGTEYRFTGRDNVQPFPQAGFPVTYASWTDNYPGTVIGFKGKTLTVREDDHKIISGSAQDGSAVYTYFENPAGREIKFRLNKAGRWVNGSVQAIVGIVGTTMTLISKMKLKVKIVERNGDFTVKHLTREEVEARAEEFDFSNHYSIFEPGNLIPAGEKLQCETRITWF